MKNQKGSWDLDSKEFQTRNTLGKIVFAETILMSLNQFILSLKKKYISEVCRYKKGDKVMYKYYTKNYRYGVVDKVSFDTCYGFKYRIEPRNKDFVKPNTPRSLIFIKDNQIDKTHISIHKF